MNNEEPTEEEDREIFLKSKYFKDISEEMFQAWRNKVDGPLESPHVVVITYNYCETPVKRVFMCDYLKSPYIFSTYKCADVGIKCSLDTYVSDLNCFCKQWKDKIFSYENGYSLNFPNIDNINENDLSFEIIPLQQAIQEGIVKIQNTNEIP